MNKEAMVNKG